MSRHDDSVRMRHMLDHAREAAAMVEGRTRADLDTNRMLQLSLTHLLEVVGEAANRVSAQTQARYPDVPWRATIGMRNRIIHGYDSVDLDIVWRILVEDLRPLIHALERAVPGHES